MRDLRMSPEIRELIGQQRAAIYIAGPYPSAFRCRACGSTGTVDAEGPIAFGLDIYDNGYRRLWLQHVACGPTGIRRAGQWQMPNENTAFGIVFAQVGPDGPWPAMVVEFPLAVIEVHGNETVDWVLSSQQQVFGMQQVSRCDTEPPPPAGVRWRVDLRRDRVVARIGGQQMSLMEPLPPILPQWLELVELRGGRAGLYVASRLGMPGIAYDEHGFHQALGQALAEGRVIGTTAVLTH